MNCQQVCPFYGQGMEPCDVGAGYISPYHVEVIVRHCTSRYEDCARYRELSKSHLGSGGEESAQLPPAMDQLVYMPSGGLVFPLQFDQGVVTILNHEIRTPLTSILSFTEILLSCPIEDRDAQRHFLRIVHDETLRLTRAIDRLFGRVDSSTPARVSAKPGTDGHRKSNLTTSVETSTP
ncbi:MAG: histidine kinase dimerization/phospho-acceptor domain-containing protein [Candidatus Contendobacter sp.]|nr:histidine kinase dimerization/phospho-acceptor domain-containing protein [Candidatus Contendobacter sp.]MDG4556267.1 histidine kinase dimerization/phospho-acceptor domain-containing protein [Candidatus Contendobacter sp.]